MPHAAEFVPLLGRLIHSANLLLEWLLTYAIHSTVLIGGLLCLTLLPVGRRLIATHSTWLWRFALVGGLITASVQSLRSEAPVTGTLRLDGDRPAQTKVHMAIDREVRSGAAWTTPSNGTTVVNASITVSPGWPLLAIAGWLVVASSLLAWFFIARARFMRVIGPRRSANHTMAANALRYLIREGNVARHVTLTLSERLTSPVALGSDEICLPERALAELGPIRMESILAHELAHLVRRDPLWLTISRVIEAVFFFQPLNIIARRRMQESAEFASDAWASSRVSRPIDLAHCLARVAEWTIAAPRLPVPAMAERRGAVLVRRVERLTTGRVIPEAVPGRALRLSAAVALLALIFVAPRAAVGADARSSAFFSRLGSHPTNGFLTIRNTTQRPGTGAGQHEMKAIMVRIDSRN